MKKHKVTQNGIELYEVLYDGPSEMITDLHDEVKDGGLLRGVARTLLKSMSGTFYIIANNPEGGWELIHYFTEHDQLYGVPVLERMIINSPGIQGLKNRTQIAKDFVSTDLQQTLVNNHQELSILDIGSGLGTYGFHALREIPDGVVHLVNIDLDERALRISRQLGDKAGLNENVDYINQEAVSFLNGTSKKFHLVVSIGILDFIDDEKGTKLLHHVAEHMEDGGHLITSGTDNYRFIGFTRLAGMKGLTPRTQDGLTDLLAKAGYSKVEVVTDDSGTQHVVRGKVK